MISNSSSAINMEGSSRGQENNSLLRNKPFITDYVMVFTENDNFPEKSKEQIKETEIRHKRNFYEDSLKTNGLVLRTEEIQMEDNNEENDANNTRKKIVRIFAPEHVLRRYCEILKIRIPIDETKVKAINNNKKKQIKNGCNCNLLCCCNTIWESDILPNAEYQWTAEYIRKLEIFKLIPGTIFSTSVRCMIVNFILERGKFSEDPADVGLAKLLSENIYEAGYPLHEGNEDDPESLKGKLAQEWASYKTIFKRQPIDHIKDYFGVKFALYFAWLGFYTHMLIPPAIFGIFCVIYGVYTLPSDYMSREICDSNINITMCPPCDHNCDYWNLNEECYYSRFTQVFDNNLTVAFAVFMSLWSVLYLEWWKRYSAEITHRWGLSGYTIICETPRTEYLQKCVAKNIKRRKINEITNLEEPSISYWKTKIPRIFVSYSLVMFWMIVALGVVLAVIFYTISVTTSKRLYGAQSENYRSLFVPITSGILNLVFIFILNYLFQGFAEKLTEYEFHRTQTEYDNSLLLKIYLFQFVNYYSSLFYIAFCKGKFTGYPQKYNRLFGYRQEECGPEGCFMELCIQLAIIMIGDQLKDNIIEILEPWYYTYKNSTKNKKDMPFLKRIWNFRKTKKGNFKQAKYDYELLSWASTEFFSEYLEMVLQYGFVTIFVAAFPLAPLFALVNNVFEIRIDAKKYINYYRRPVAQRVKDIGVWFNIMDIIGKLSVASNAFIIAFTSNFIPKFVYTYIVSPNGTSQGYLNFTLAYFDIKDFEIGMGPNLTKWPNLTTCRYEAFRNPPWHSEKYAWPPMYWQIMTFRLAFVVFYTYLAYIIVTAIQLIIPDVPKKLQDKKRREAYLLREILIRENRRSLGTEFGYNTYSSSSSYNSYKRNKLSSQQEIN